MGWRRVKLEQLLNRVDHLNSPSAPTHPNRQADAAEFIDDVQELEGAAVHRLVELEVDCPDVVRVFRAQQFPAATGRPRALTHARLESLETFLTPDPLHLLVIDATAMAPGKLTNPPC